MLEENFNTFARNSWDNCNGTFTNKTKGLSKHLLSWSKKKKSLQHQLANTEEEIRQVQISQDRHNLVDKEKYLIQKYDMILEKLSDHHRQRAKQDWIKDDDRNTSFFQQAAIKRRRKNRIASIVCNDDYITNPNDIAQIFINYFSDLFCSNRTNNPNAYCPHVYTSQEIDWQVQDEEEIWKIIKDMRRNASPGPDGLNAAFYKAAWGWIKNDLMELIRNFYHTGNIRAELNKTNIVLIPKKISDPSVFAMFPTKLLLNLLPTE